MNLRWVDYKQVRMMVMYHSAQVMIIMDGNFEHILVMNGM